MTATATVSARAQTYYSPTIYGDKYSVSVNKANYASIDTVLGLGTPSEDPPNDSDSSQTASQLVRNGKLVPIKLGLKNGKKRRQAHVICTPVSVDAALNPTTGLKGKKYGTWTIDSAYCEMDRAYTY